MRGTALRGPAASGPPPMARAGPDDGGCVTAICVVHWSPPEPVNLTAAMYSAARRNIGNAQPHTYYDQRAAEAERVYQRVDGWSPSDRT
jgi:hypothetical protein